MPFIESAGAVDIVCVTAGKTNGQALPGSDLAPQLAHHGIKVTVTALSAENGIGEAILSHARMIGAPAVVMGAYAHSKLHQIVWGGVTQYALAHAHLPVLMVH
jgi:nucleotide-binding universal stress UspA family protein